MDSLIRPLGTESYEVAREIISLLLEKGFISQSEFNAIDNVNRKYFMLNTA